MEVASVGHHRDAYPDRQASLVSDQVLPLQIICDMMGIPQGGPSAHFSLVISVHSRLAFRSAFDRFMQVSADIGAYATALAENRRVNTTTIDSSRS